MRRIRIPAQPDSKREEVQIVELPDDDQTETTNESIMIVTQPTEQKEIISERKEEEEEEVIVLEKTLEGKTKIRKIKKPVKIEEEVVIEIEVQEDKKHVVKKKLTAYKPSESEEINELEITNELKPFEADSKKEIPLNTHVVAAEATPTGLVTQILEEQIPSENVVVNISTYSAISREVTLPDEKEEYHEKTKVTAFTAKPSVDAIETYQVSEENVQNLPGTFEDTFKPTYFIAAPSILSNDSITVSETREEQSILNIQKEDAATDVASVSLMLQEATSVSETEVVDKEETLDKGAVPKTNTASRTYITQEGVTVEEVQGNISEGSLDVEKTITSKPKINVNTLESLIVEEVFADNKPGKHLPESFVPTEMANKRIVPQKQIVSSEIVAPELESEFIPGRLPPMQQAGFDLSVSESLLVAQVHPEDKETTFTESVPEKNNASEEMLLCESVMVSVVDSQMPTKEVTTEKTDQQTATVEYSTKKSVIATTTLVNETGKDYQPEDNIESKTATTEIICLETSNVSDVVVQDTESPLAPDIRPTPTTAEKSIKAVLPLTISEVETADSSETFVNYPKYTTQEATSEILTQTAKEITETQFGEKESLYSETKPSSYNINTSISDMQVELEVRETKYMERESNLEDFQLPDSYKGKTVSTHLLPTSVVEEITPENTTASLSEEKPKQTSANLTQSTFDEMVVSEAMLNESLGLYKPDQKLEDKQANITISHNQSISVTEIISDDKENVYLPTETPKQCQATLDIDSQKVASTTEVTSNFLPDILAEDKPHTDTAKTEQSILESVQVMQYETAEKEKEHAVDVIPDTKKAIPNIVGANTEINVTQILLHEKEGQYETQEKPKEVSALTGVATQEVAIQSETETVVHADNLPDDEPITGKAKKYARPLQELIVTEATPVDIHKDLPQDIFPYKKQANVGIIPGQQLIVTEIVTDDKEAKLEMYNEPEGKHASAAVSERETAVQEETLAHFQPNEFKRISPEKDVCTPMQDISHHVVQTEFTAGEKECKHSAEIRPDSKQVNVSFEEGQSVSVIEIQSGDKESFLEKPDLPSVQHSEPNVESYRVATKTETLADDSIKTLDKSETIKMEAFVSHSVFQSLTLSESNLHEKESPFKEAVPELKTATMDLLLGKSIAIEAVTTGEKEQNFGAMETPDLHHAQPQISGNVTAEKMEIHTDDTYENIETTQPTSAIANTGHLELQSIIESQTTASESESTLLENFTLDKKNASVTLEAVTVPEVLEVISQDKEKNLDKLEKPTERKAEQLLDVQPVAQTTMTTPENTVREAEIQKPTEAKANIEQTTMESITQTHSVATESEGILKTFEPDTKHANIEFVEGKSINVTEITSADRENDYASKESIKEHTVETQVDTHSVVQKEEVVANDFINELNISQPAEASAERNFLPYNTSVTSELLLSESEKPFTESEQPIQKTASVKVDEDQSIVIQSVIPEDKESYLADYEQPEGKFGATALTKLQTVAIKEEIVSNQSFEKFETTSGETTTANKETIPYESITQIDLVAGESEDRLDDYLKADAHTASADVLPSSSLIVSEVTLADTNEAYVLGRQPEGKFAHVDVDVTHKLIQQSSTTASETIAALSVDSPELSTANKATDASTSLIVSEINIQETGVELIDKYKPSLSNAIINLEQGKVVQKVEEVYTQDKEENIENTEVGERKQATSAYSTHEVASTLEIISTIDVDNLEQQAQHDQTTANVAQTTFEGIISEQPDIHESEGNLEVNLKTTPKTADLKLEETSSVNVAEVTATENENVLDTQPVPQLASAQKDVVKVEATQISEILTNMSLGDIPKETPIRATAELNQDYFEGLIHTQNVPTDAEQILEIQKQPENKKAEINVKFMSGVIVTEIYSETKEENYTAPQEIQEQATSQIDSLKSLQQSQIVLQDTVLDMPVPKVQPLHVKVEQSVFDSISSTENVLHEKEAALHLPKLPEGSTADSCIAEQQYINVIEVVDEERETTFDKTTDTTKHFASSNMLEQQPIQQFEIQPQNTAVPIVEKYPDSEAAKSVQSNYESLIISENNPQEKETYFSSTASEEKLADVIVLPEKHIYTAETLIEDKEGILKEDILQPTKAEKSILPQLATEVTQTISNQDVTTLETTTPTEGVTTLPEQIVFETISVTEFTHGDKEDTFEEERRSLEIASPQIDITGKSAVTCEISIENKESLMPKQETQTGVATCTLLEEKSVEQYKTSVLHSVDLLPETETPKRKAITKQSTVEGIVQTVVSATEQEKDIEIAQEDNKTAQLTITTQESINVTVIHPQEKEGDKVIIGTANEGTAEENIKQQQVAVKEEILSLNATDILKPDSFNVTTAKQIEPNQQHGLIVSEQKSTGELQSVPCMAIPDTKKCTMAVEDTTSSVLVSQIQLHEKEGK